MVFVKNSKMLKLITTIVFTFALFLNGCAPFNTGSTYSKRDMGRISTVMRGKILATREVKISGDSQLGIITGAGIGGTAGSTVGGSTEGNIVGAIAGAVAGGIAGAAVEEGVTKGTATEFIIEQENEHIIALVQTNEDELKAGEKVLILRSNKVRLIRENISK